MSLQVKSDDLRLRTAALAACAVLVLACASAAAADPSAQEILLRARMNESAQNRELQGRLRNGPRVIPFRLVLDGNVIKYVFSNPSQTLLLRLGENTSNLEEISNGGSDRVREARFDTAVRDTDISYEDIALRFLYWPKAAVVGEQILLTRNTWKLLLEPASRKDSRYGTVMLWVEKQSGALLRADGYDWSGNFVKRFEVRSVQRIDGGWILKQMRIQRMEDGKDKTPTYLEIEKPQ